MEYYFVRYIPDWGDDFPFKNGRLHPAFIAECYGCPLGVAGYHIEKYVPDPFERALLLATGIIVEYTDRDLENGTPSYYKRAWRVKKLGINGVRRGHPIKIKGV
jgi:hypothetical protein